MSPKGVHRPVLVLFATLVCGLISFPLVKTALADPQCPVPSFENRIETEHFVLKWTSSSSHEPDNIKDPEIINETAVYLEAAWKKLTALFGRDPYTPPGSSKVGVIFHDLDCYAYADPPDGPIELNSAVWTRKPSIRQSTSAHELFHKLQYAYGYKTRWAPQPHNEWFIEGTAAWAEVFVWGRVTRNCKIEDMFRHVKLDLMDAEDMALPFWIYFVSGNTGKPRDQLMVRFFERCEQEKGDVSKALFDVIQDAYGSVDEFFVRFSLARRSGFWKETGSCSGNYMRILGPDGRDLVAEIRKLQHKKREHRA